MDLDIQAFFDRVPWDLVLKAVAHHTDQRWILMYVERWLKAPLQREDGSLVARERGTPQGSAISPLLANLFLHYAFDAWMAREFPAVPFERYCDDIILHAESERQARALRAAIARRLAECGTPLNEQKTRIVYCKNSMRHGSYEHERFTFLGYTFRPRLARSKHGGQFVGFLPAIGDDEQKRIGRADPPLVPAPSHGPHPQRPGRGHQRRGPGLVGSTARRRISLAAGGFLAVARRTGRAHS